MSNNLKVFCLFLFSLYYLPGRSQKKSTYFKDIEPIIQEKCVSCHRTGGSAPFSLTSYSDVAKRGTFIYDVIQQGYMPPWKPNKHYITYADERALNNKEIETIREWVKQSMPEGNPKDRNSNNIKKWEAQSLQNNKKPDAILHSKVSYVVKGDNLERFIVFKIPFELSDSFSVETMEFYCSNKKLIHHANYAFHPVDNPAIDLYKTDDYVDLTEEDRTKYNQYFKYKSKLTYYGGWIPGSLGEKYPGNIGWVMPKRGIVLLTVHFAPQAKDEEVQVGVNLFFKSTKIERVVKVISLGSGGIGEEQITPTLTIQKNEISKHQLRVVNSTRDVSLIFVWPHMHYVGKDFLAYAISPVGDTIRLAHIPDWDYRWQELYKFEKMVRLPKGATIVIEGTYDNTAKNPFNPFNPPKTIYSSGDMRSFEEMMTLLLIYVPYEEGDEKRILK